MIKLPLFHWVSLLHIHLFLIKILNGIGLSFLNANGRAFSLWKKIIPSFFTLAGFSLYFH